MMAGGTKTKAFVFAKRSIHDSGRCAKKLNAVGAFPEILIDPCPGLLRAGNRFFGAHSKNRIRFAARCCDQILCALVALCQRPVQSIAGRWFADWGRAVWTP